MFSGRHFRPFSDPAVRTLTLAHNLSLRDLEEMPAAGGGGGGWGRQGGRKGAGRHASEGGKGERRLWGGGGPPPPLRAWPAHVVQLRPAALVQRGGQPAPAPSRQIDSVPRRMPGEQDV